MRSAQDRRILQAFGKQVAKVRKRRGVTQVELAAQLDVSINTISNIENGNRGMNLTTLHKLAHILDWEEAKKLFR